MKTRETKFLCGGEQDRTADPLLAKQVLSQLSYAPDMVGPSGFEPLTPVLSGLCSNQLSYGPKFKCLSNDRRPACLRQEIHAALKQTYMMP